MAEILSHVDAVVVGAGMAGLAAARRLRQRGLEVVVVEARDRIGGRICTLEEDRAVLDLGASWIHGPKGNPVAELAREAGARSIPTDDDSQIVYDEQGKQVSHLRLVSAERHFQSVLEMASRWAEDRDRDCSLWRAIKAVESGASKDPFLRYMLSACIEFDFGGPAGRLSAWYYEEDQAFPGTDVILPDGYASLTRHLAQDLRIVTATPVDRFDYRDDGVRVRCGHTTIEAGVAVVTIPLGVLKTGRVEFDPPLPASKRRALRRLPMGNLNKVVALYDRCTWPEQPHYFGAVGGDPSWFSYLVNLQALQGVPGLVTFSFGDAADEMEKLSDEQIGERLLGRTRGMFGPGMPRPRRLLVTRWRSEPFSGGAYSYNGVGCTPDDFRELARPVGQVLFFAGEHTSADYRGTVHGALLSGLRAADEASRARGGG